MWQAVVPDESSYDEDVADDDDAERQSTDDTERYPRPNIRLKPAPTPPPVPPLPLPRLKPAVARCRPTTDTHQY